jgi:hypothetical protein
VQDRDAKDVVAANDAPRVVATETAAVQKLLPKARVIDVLTNDGRNRIFY